MESLEFGDGSLEFGESEMGVWSGESGTDGLECVCATLQGI